MISDVQPVGFETDTLGCQISPRRLSFFTASLRSLASSKKNYSLRLR